MIAGPREVSHQPLDDISRRRLFIAAIVIIALAATITLLDHHRRPASRAPSPATALPRAPGGSVPLAPRPRRRRPSRPAGGSRSDVAGVRRAARRFLAGYLPYSYERGPAKTITAATIALRDRLAAQPPRVPRRERRRRPHLRLLQTDAVSRHDASARALVGDGARAYTVELHLIRRAAGWRVSDVGA